MIDEESFSTLWKLVIVGAIDLSLICRSRINELLEIQPQLHRHELCEVLTQLNNSGTFTQQQVTRYASMES